MFLRGCRGCHLESAGRVGNPQKVNMASVSFARAFVLRWIAGSEI